MYLVLLFARDIGTTDGPILLHSEIVCLNHGHARVRHPDATGELKFNHTVLNQDMNELGDFERQDAEELVSTGTLNRVSAGLTGGRQRL